ncbi:hypothetical protein EFR00_29855 [Rhizobium sophoriradicis]|nr:hypothetical protein EFR00_29855 [Rhizobium sophoriradicis]
MSSCSRLARRRPNMRVLRFNFYSLSRLSDNQQRETATVPEAKSLKDATERQDGRARSSDARKSMPL